MKTDAYFDNAVMNAAEELKSRGLIDFQISSTGTEMFTTVQDETFSAGNGDIAAAAEFGRSVLALIEKSYGKPLCMRMTQHDISMEKMSGVMSVRVEELTQ
ncbi:hypothetical protein BED35_07440 [Yersinia enterocolitica]|nr:hypothetical protein [Yersinia enterocolitica]AOF14220.1 hypothetical protein BB936_06740 [Yersinia enterocolitica]AOF14951.1 hypothetical protein BB936_11205 [Yersinia enterocolitica]AOF18334.1 hypothetical protein BED34_06635 [Yersinia enterocolitica]AOF18398.1 hypothetical protein BED34_06990 [Yersinia enterocolitica]AOF22865.1 hypothetical protein BED33_09295 [Yersinia enterocolitica]